MQSPETNSDQVELPRERCGLCYRFAESKKYPTWGHCDLIDRNTRFPPCSANVVCTLVPIRFERKPEPPQAPVDSVRGEAVEP
jgi:hypothetical protein